MKNFKNAQIMYIVVSLTAHICVFFTWQTLSKKSVKEITFANQKIEIEFLNSSEKGSGNRSNVVKHLNKKQENLNTKNRSQEKKTLVKKIIGSNKEKYLAMINLDVKKTSGKTKGLNRNKKYDSYAKNGVHGVMQSMGFIKAVESLPFFEKIWKKVNSATPYPEDFVKQRISGKVTVHLEVDHRGVFTGNFLKVKSTDSYLEVYVLAVLINTLKNPIDIKLWRKKYNEVMPVSLTFDFKTYSTHGITSDVVGRHVKNSMSFERLAYVEPVLNEKVNQLFTKYMPPIIPIPGGFYIDFIRLYKMIEGRGKPLAEDLRLTRLRLMKAELERMIQKAKKKI